MVNNGHLTDVPDVLSGKGSVITEYQIYEREHSGFMVRYNYKHS